MRAALWVPAAIALFILVSRVTRAVFLRSLSVRHGDSRQTLSCGVAGAKRALVVYQPSKSGSTGRAARRLAERARNAGYDVDMNVPGSHLPTDLSAYALVAFGSPVYTGQVSSVLVDYMRSVRGLPNGKVLVFSVGMVVSQAPELVTLQQALGAVETALALKLHFRNDAGNSRQYETVYELALR